MIKLVIPARTALPWHTHPMPNAGYVLSGELTIQDRQTGKSQTFHAGQAFAESVDDIHRGVSGDAATTLSITYAGTPGVQPPSLAKGKRRSTSIGPSYELFGLNQTRRSKIVLFRRRISSAAEACRAAAQAAMDAFGGIDILANTAAIAPGEQENTEALWERILNINLKGAKLMSDAVLPKPATSQGNAAGGSRNDGSHADRYVRIDRMPHRQRPVEKILCCWSSAHFD